MMFEILSYTLIGVTLIYAFYKWVTINKNYFAIRKIKALEPVFFFGNTGGLFQHQYRPNDYLDIIYYAHPNEP